MWAMAFSEGSSNDIFDKKPCITYKGAAWSTLVDVDQPNDRFSNLRYSQSF
jgi:hypothetical protein